MNDKKQIKESENTLSKLERFSLEFEYDKTFRQIRHEVKIRAISS